MNKRVFILAIAITAAAGQSGLDSISPESLRVNLTYLASDELKGRATPSHGLDLAADYIADQFHREGLEPIFQSAKFAQVTTKFEGFMLILKSGSKQLSISPDEVSVRSLVALDVKDAPATLVLPGRGRRARDASDPYLVDMETHPAPKIYVYRADAAALLRANHDATVTVHLAKPLIEEVNLRNVAAILPGSDAALRDQYVLLTAHYDHIGATSKGIFHGANDNASGTVSVIEIARVLARLTPPPRRSILFITFFGEEEGLLGSTWYVHHPLVPLKDTIAEINLEQLGRTDEQTGREMGAFALTGPSYSNLSPIFAAAAKTEGVRIWKRPDADEFLNRSDNYPFAQQGIVDTTIGVAFEFPDYHAIGDTIEKIDFPNMAKVDRGIAAAVLQLANEPDVPKWLRKPPLLP